jgi:hypothetical protein
MGTKLMLWDQTWKFEFDRLENGEYQVTHKCTKFAGPFPVRMIVWLHQKYVIWACEKYINKTDFGSEDADLDQQQAIIGNIPKHLVKEYSGVDTMKQRKDIQAMYEDPNTEFWRLEAIANQRPGFRKFIKAPPVTEESEESED